ncbi:hypothetical protein ACJMK2_004749 [Sinanodonta woodiana]|uniref:Uncharacterized protein n=1 Tax=Sinanodonta woodiana TaxID=1069815 RepID=A0ABD3VPA3_SINWO
MQIEPSVRPWQPKNEDVSFATLGTHLRELTKTFDLAALYKSVVRVASLRLLRQEETGRFPGGWSTLAARPVALESLEIFGCGLRRRLRPRQGYASLMCRQRLFQRIAAGRIKIRLRSFFVLYTVYKKV